MTDRNCPVCGDGFSSESSLDDHCWDAHGACHHCGAEFDEREAVYAHWLTAHENKLSSTDRARAESVAGEPTFRDRLTQQGPVGAIADAGLTGRTVLVASRSPVLRASCSPSRSSMRIYRSLPDLDAPSTLTS